MHKCRHCESHKHSKITDIARNTGSVRGEKIACAHARAQTSTQHPNAGMRNSCKVDPDV